MKGNGFTDLGHIRLNSTSFNGRGPRQRSENRTVLIDGETVIWARQRAAYTQEELCYQTHRTVHELAMLEAKTSSRGQFHRRYQSKLARNELAGLGRSTISRIERGGAKVYVSTLLILARTLNVAVEDLRTSS